jgi:hypothetical protein
MTKSNQFQSLWSRWRLVVMTLVETRLMAFESSSLRMMMVMKSAE